VARVTAVLIALAVAVLCIPWSPSFLKDGAEEALSRRMGCVVSVERVTLWPILGRLTLRNVKADYSRRAEEFRFTGLGEPIWSLREAVVTVQPSQWIHRKSRADVEVALRDPDPLVVGIEAGTVALFPPLRDIVERASSATTSRRWRLLSLSVENANVQFVPPAAAGAKRDRPALSQIHADYAADPEAPGGRLSVEGQVGQGNRSPFQVQLVRRGALWTLRAQSEPVPFGQRWEETAPTTGMVDAIHLHGQLQRATPNRWDFHLDGRCPRIEALGVAEESASLTLRGQLDGRTSHAAVSLALSSRRSRLDAAGDLDLAGSSDSRTTVSVERLDQGWFELYNRRRAPQWPMIGGGRGNLTVAAAARFRRRPFALEQPHATVVLKGFDLTSDYFPFTIGDVDYAAEVKPDLIEIRRCRGQWPHGWASLHGTFSGSWWRPWAGTARLGWAFHLRIEDLLTTLPLKAEAAMTTKALAALARRPFVEGDLDGSGTLVLAWEPSLRPTAPTTKTLQGTVTVRRGLIAHPLLPAPVTDIDGSFDLSPRRLEIRSVGGRLLGTTATISADLTGEPFFWNEPHAQCLILINVALADAVRWAPEQVRPRIEALEPRGNATALLSLAGPLHRPLRQEDIAATGTVLFRNVAFRSPTWALAGTFHDVQGRLDLSEGALHLTTATGWIERVPIALRAEASPQGDRFTARLESTAPFEALQQVMPRALSRFRVGGTLASWFEFEASGSDLFKKAFQLRDLTSRTLTNLPFQWDLRGEVFPRDVQLTFETFPTSLTAINGRVSLKRFEWTFDDLTSSWGKTEHCKIGGGGRFRPGNWPAMHIELEAPVLYLDEWVRPWRRSAGSRFPPRVANPVYELTGVVRGPRAFYRGHPGENFHGEFTLASPYRRVDTFTFSNTRADLYGGQINGEGRVEFKYGLSTCTLEVASKNVSLPPFLQCETGREQTFVGQLTGNAAFFWRNGDSNTLTGQGRLEISDSQFFGNIFFRKLGQMIRIPLLDTVTFARIAAPFRLARRRVISDNLVMEGPLISVEGQGTVGFDHSLDSVLEIGFPHLPQYVWLLDLVVHYFGKVPASVFSLDLTGTWDDPQYSFHHLDTAEQGLLGALGQAWGLVAPSSPPPPIKPVPVQPKGKQQTR